MRVAPRAPEEGWTSCLGNLPEISFGTLYEHFVERPNAVVLGEILDPQQTEEAERVVDVGECTPSFRGIAKGYRFFKSGHVQNIEFHNLPDVSEFCYVRAKVLPSMVKNKMYSVTLCLRNNGDVHVAFCVCPAGLAGSCNHVAALIYALEEFVRLGLREESRLPCTSKLQAWNKPRARNVEPMPVHSVELVAEQYRKKKNEVNLGEILIPDRPTCGCQTLRSKVNCLMTYRRNTRSSWLLTNLEM